MIDRKQFANTFQSFDKETIIMIIDLFVDHYPHMISSLEQNIADPDLVQLKVNIHRLKGTLSQFYDPISSAHAAKIETLAQRKILEIIETLTPEYPESLSELRKNTEDREIIEKVTNANTLTAFFEGIAGPGFTIDKIRIIDLEMTKISDDIPPLFSKLKTSFTALIGELLAMKKELIL